MKTELPHPSDPGNYSRDAGLAELMEEIVRAIRGVQYGSVEVIIQNSKVVQVERKEKSRFDKPAKV